MRKPFSEATPEDLGRIAEVVSGMLEAHFIDPVGFVLITGHGPLYRTVTNAKVDRIPELLENTAADMRGNPRKWDEEKVNFLKENEE